MKNNKIIFSIVIALLSFNTSLVIADTPLSAAEVKVLFSGKTFDGYNESKGKYFQVYSDPDGTMIHQNSNRTKEATWEVESGGAHCGILKRRVCGKIVPMGNGVYHKIKDGEHTHTLKNFVEGNQL